MKLVDLFCGAGGFSLGAHLSGFGVAAAYDNDATLTSSFELNFPQTKLCLADISTLTSAQILHDVGGTVDGVFGGPPCQGFSEIGRRAEDDPRRGLLGQFFRLVWELEPSFFVMENVRGLMHRNTRDLLNEFLTRTSRQYALLGPVILDASNYGAATRRPRLFVVGLHRDLGGPLCEQDILVRQAPSATVAEAIEDLRGAVRLTDKDGFDIWKLRKYPNLSKLALSMRNADNRSSGHIVTTHNDTVTARFRILEGGKIDRIGRHAKLRWDGQCPTLRAGTGSDRGRFQSVRPVHPAEPRVITVREAARLQGFPDAHWFHPTIWHSFRMIGNSVSPIMARAIFSALRERLGLSVDSSKAVA